MLLKKGTLAQLIAVNIEQQPDIAQKLGVRSVPWLQIGHYQLTGLQPLEAIEQRIHWMQQGHELVGRFDTLLSTGRAQTVINEITAQADNMQAIMDLLADSATVLSTRIGIGVIMEEFAETELLKQQFQQLAALSQHDDARIRADACHYLSLTADKAAIPVLQARLQDENIEVQEVAEDALETLTA